MEIFTDEEIIRLFLASRDRQRSCENKPKLGHFGDEMNAREANAYRELGDRFAQEMRARDMLGDNSAAY